MKASSMWVDSVYHSYPSPTIDRPGSSFEPELASTEAIDGMEAAQEQSNRVYPKRLEPKDRIRIIGP